MNSSNITEMLVLVVGGLGGLAWRSLKSATERASQEQAAEWSAQRNRAAMLERELEKVRGTERQELRFTSYGELWAEMRPLAIYETSAVNQETMAAMSEKLSDWYFSERGGLMLTSHNRELYFALQDLLSTVSTAKPAWTAKRAREPGPREIFEALLRRRKLIDSITLIERLDEDPLQDWPRNDVEVVARKFRTNVQTLAKDWGTLEDTEQFAVLQQVSSVLRTSLTKDVESRLR